MQALKNLAVGWFVLFLLPIAAIAQSNSNEKGGPVRFTLAAGETITFNLEVSSPEGRSFSFDNQGLDYIYLSVNGYPVDFIIDSYYYCGGQDFCCKDTTCYMPDDGRGYFDLSEFLVPGVNEIVLMGEGDPGTLAEVSILLGEANEAGQEAEPAGINRPPVFNVPPTPPAGVTRIVEVGTTLTFMVRATDPDVGDQVRLTAIGLPTGAVFPPPPLANPAQGTFTWTPTAAQGGLYTVTFRAQDTRGLNAPPHRVNIMVRVRTNSPPTFVSPTPAHDSTLTVEVARPLTFTVRAADPDVGDNVRLRIIGLPAGASFPPPTPANPVTATFNWTPTLSQVRMHTVIITATDSRELAGRPLRLHLRVRIPQRGEPFVNIPPTPPRRVPIIVNPEAPVSFDVMATDPDPPDRITLGVAGLPAGASFVIPTPANPARSQFNWTPAFDQIGSYTVTFTARDNRGLSTGPYRLRIIVRSPAPNRPLFDSPPTPARDSTLNIPLGGTLTFTVQATDPSGGNVTLGTINLPAGATFAIPPPSTTVSSEFRWTPTAAQVGTYRIAFTATSDSGLSAVRHTLIINVFLPFDRPPAFAVPPTPPAGGRMRVNFGGPLAFTVRASDPDTGDLVSLRVIGLPQGASFPIPAPANPVSSDFIWTPTAAQIGSHTVTFAAQDNRASFEVLHPITILVGPLPNNAPAFDTPPTPPSQTPLSILVGERLSFQVRASDIDEDDTVTLAVAGLPAGATFPIPPAANPAGSEFTWTPSAEQVGSTSVSFSARDNRGLETARSVTINVAPQPNRAPFFNLPPTPAEADPLLVDAGGTLTFIIQASDPNPGDLVTLGVAGLPTGATFVIPAPANPVRSSFNWSPGLDQVGSYTVTFTATDNQGLSASPYRIRIAVRQPANQRPRFVPPTPAPDTTLNARAGTLLTFTVQASSPDGADVTLGARNLPLGTSFPIPPAASTVSSEFRWTPTAAQAGTYMVIFTARDNRGLASLPHRVFINVVR